VVPNATELSVKLVTFAPTFPMSVQLPELYLYILNPVSLLELSIQERYTVVPLAVATRPDGEIGVKDWLLQLKYGVQPEAEQVL
jgi:hypothetical protein